MCQLAADPPGCYQISCVFKIKASNEWPLTVPIKTVRSELSRAVIYSFGGQTGVGLFGRDSSCGGRISDIFKSQRTKLAYQNGHP